MQLVITLAADVSGEPAPFLDLLHRQAWAGHFDDAEAGVLAEIDQHAAAVRDALSPGVGELDTGDLAAYARGVAVVSSGWDWTTVPAETHRWVRLRLASVSYLAS